MTPIQATIRTLLAVSTLLPLVSAIVSLFFGQKVLKKKTAWFAIAMMGVSFFCAFVAACLFLGKSVAPFTWLIPWIPVPSTKAGYLYLGLYCDQLTVGLMVMVTLISTLVHLYSVGYMAGDKRYERFFCYLSAFTFAMLGIVTANGLMQLFVFWELVGLASYLLIGFWFEKRGPQLACKKAFVMNRIGDTGFLIGFGILFYKLGAQVLLPSADGGMFDAMLTQLGGAEHILHHPPMWLTIAGIGLFFGAIGKSAQFPLHTWLPDAMEGPTPVSSIVHSATMVAAGVYLTARIYPILTPAAHLFISIIGLITLVMAAIMAMVMTDIKKVLAYSTLSQLGYMILGVGSGAYIFALFHLITHAFFKCCLFQCSGSVINAAHHQQDMAYYGGLGRKMPKTALAYGIAMLAIAGASIPFTTLGISGFYSKDGIIAGTYNYAHALGGWGCLFFIGPVLVAYITPFYMARSFALTFMGQPRDEHLYEHVHEAPWTMTVPQLVLALFAVISVPWFLPWQKLIVATQQSLLNAGITWMPGLEELEHGEHFIHAPLLFGFAWIVMIGLGIWMYKDGFGKAARIARLPGVRQLHTWALNKFYFDALYDIFVVEVVKTFARLISFIDKWVVDGLVNLIGWFHKELAAGIGWFDNRVVDGLVNGASDVTRFGGNMLRTTQSGRVRLYVLLLVVSGTLATLLTVVVTMVGG